MSMGEPVRALEISYELPPQTPLEKSRDIRQVSHCEWSLARRARAKSRRLQEWARALIRASQALMERQKRGAIPHDAPASVRTHCDTIPLSRLRLTYTRLRSHADEFSD